MVRLVVSFCDMGAVACGASDVAERWSEIFEIEHAGLEEALFRKMSYGTRSLTYEAKPAEEGA